MFKSMSFAPPNLQIQSDLSSGQVWQLSEAHRGHLKATSGFLLKYGCYISALFVTVTFQDLIQGPFSALKPEILFAGEAKD